MTIGILALAAGRSRRFGSDKRAARLADGRTLLDSFLTTLAATKLPYLVCLSANDHEWAAQLDAQSVNYYHCTNSADGMGSTLAEGISQVEQWRGVVVALADMPWVQTQTFLRLAKHIRPGGIVVPTHGKRRGNPVGFSNTFFPELKNLQGDKGARALLEIHAENVLELEVDDTNIHRDVDTPGNIGTSPDCQ